MICSEFNIFEMVSLNLPGPRHTGGREGEQELLGTSDGRYHPLPYAGVSTQLRQENAWHRFALHVNYRL